MRLLDHVAQCAAPFVVRQHNGDLWKLPGAADFARDVTACPLRYVLRDELVRLCVELAFSGGDELAGCLDLLHVPAEGLWVEWSEPACRAELKRALPELAPRTAGACVRAGALISAHPGGRTATLRTFWLSDGASEPLLAPVQTLIDLDATADPVCADALLAGCAVRVDDSHSDEIDRILQCACFRLDPQWQRYYASAAVSAASRELVIREALAAVAFDVPMLLALFLLMSLRVGLPQTVVDPARLNAKRARLGREPLLEHFEVSAPVFDPIEYPHGGNASASLRAAPRFHHVRGHIVRRFNAIFWRRPHWRGHMRLGQVRSRTVDLRVS
jgi:hypothetical protein